VCLNDAVLSLVADCYVSMWIDLGRFPRREDRDLIDALKDTTYLSDINQTIVDTRVTIPLEFQPFGSQ
jgi:hypothetical protein